MDAAGRGSLGMAARRRAVPHPPAAGAGLMLIKVGPGFSVLVVQGDFGNFEQVEILPLEAVAALVFDSYVPVRGFGFAGELDRQAISVSQRVLPEDVFSPFI